MSTAASEGVAGSAPRPKTFDFPLTVSLVEGRRVAVSIDGKAGLEVVPPPEFRGPDPSTWSPEDLFVSATASCLAITFTGLAEKAEVPIASLTVDATGTAGIRPDGKFGFIRIQQRLVITTQHERADEARRLAEKAEETCLVASSLSLPVETEIEVRVY